MMKLVLKGDDLNDAKSRREAMKAVSSLRNVDSLAVDKEKKMLTVVGNVDPVEVVRKLRKLMHAEIESAGPYKEEKEKKDGGKDEKNIGLEEITRAFYYNYGYYPYYWPSNYKN